MKRFRLQVTQEFDCIYEVDAESVEDAWDKLMEGLGDPVDQFPGNVSCDIDEAQIKDVTREEEQ